VELRLAEAAQAIDAGLSHGGEHLFPSGLNYGMRSFGHGHPSNNTLFIA
jgi:hypothetical protein